MAASLPDGVAGDLVEIHFRKSIRAQETRAKFEQASSKIIDAT